MARPTFDSASSSASSASETSRTFSHTNAGNLLVIFVWMRSTVTSLGVTYAGVAATLVSSVGSVPTLYMYILASPATGANNVVVSWTNLSQCVVSVNSYNGTSSTNPYGTAVTNIGTGGLSTSISVASGDDDIVVDCINAYRSNSATAPSLTVAGSQTQRSTQTIVFAGTPFSGRQNSSDYSASGTLSMAWTLANQTNFYQIGIALHGISGTPRAIIF